MGVADYMGFHPYDPGAHVAAYDVEQITRDYTHTILAHVEQRIAHIHQSP
jgi:hypothetical protein